MNLRLFFELHKTKFKIGISIVIVVLLLTFIIYSVVSKPKLKIPFYSRKSNTYTSIKSSNNAFQISLNNDYGLENTTSNSYILHIHNSKEFSLTVSQVQKYNFSLEKILKSDQQTFLNSLGNYTDLSEIHETKYKNISGYSYSLKYIHNSKEYKLTEFITEINNNLYFFDIQYPVKYETKYENLKIELLNSILPLN